MDEKRSTTYSTRHVLAAFRRIELLIQSYVEIARSHHVTDERFNGLYVSENNVDELLAKPTGEHFKGPGSSEILARMKLGLEEEEESAKRARGLCTQHGAVSRLDGLASSYGLNAFETECLLLCLAPDIDLKYERLFGYLQDDLTKRRPSVELALSLLVAGSEERIAARDCFSLEAPLFRNELLEFVEEVGVNRPPLLGRLLRVGDRISAYLLGSDRTDQRLLNFTSTVEPAKQRNGSASSTAITERLLGFLENVATAEPGVVYLRGPYGSGAQEFAESVCTARGLKLIVVDTDRLANSPEPLGTMLSLLHRESFLQEAALLFRDFDSLLGDDKQTSAATFVRSLGNQRQIVFCSGEGQWRPLASARRNCFVSLDLRHLDGPERASLWSVALNGELSSQAEAAVKEIATKFRFTAGQIHDAAYTARNLAGWNQMKRGDVSPHELYEACRMHSNQRLATLARKVRRTNSWSDIVLPSDRLEHLREMCNHVRFRERVYAEWGFERKLSYGKALTALFAGPSGTGKTMAAGIIASELSLDLYKIDLSTVVSKYIGETERNLARIFNEAETSNAILFFDEADALFGKRSEVRDSHDRYANIETGYLLQRMEEYEGIAILATNFRRNMDEAFVRRLQFTIEFPLPGAVERLRIWQAIWPEGIPLSENLDLEFMARRYEISGGHIRNIALAAAFIAASEQRKVEMSHLRRATRRELQKMGKIIAEGEFDTEPGLLAAQG